MSEIWEDIKGYKGHYQVSNKSRFRSLKHSWGKRKHPKILSPRTNNRGYVYIMFCKNNKPKNFQVHRLVAKAFIPNPKNKPCINHIDGNPSNNNVSNLEWCTYSENNQHKNSDISKLTKKQVLEIRAAWPLGCFTQKEIAESYEVDQSLISYIVNDKIWTNV